MSKIVSIGAGHVGLPLSLKFWQAGHDVTVVDIDARKISNIREGRMPFTEPGCDELLLEAAASSRFQSLTSSVAAFQSSVAGAQYVVLTLGTPLGTDYTFRFDQYFDVLERIVPHLQRGVSIIVRSTVAPHFTRNVVTSRIANGRHWVAGVDFFPAFCPERLVQGQALADVDDLPEIIGADDARTAARAQALFETLTPHKTYVVVTTVEAELAKLFLNTFRYTMFGLANEFALAAEQYGADIFAILKAANTDYPRGGIPRPGPSRGPCLGKDTATLAFSTATGLIAHAAIKTNENVVLHAAQAVRDALGGLSGKRIAVLGLAFKGDSDDVRDNLTVPLVNLLDREGAFTAIFDPLVPGYGDGHTCRGSDAVILMTAHAAFRALGEAELIELCGKTRDAIFVLDMWNVWPWADHVFGRGSDEYDEDTRDRRLRLADARRRSTPA